MEIKKKKQKKKKKKEKKQKKKEKENKKRKRNNPKPQKFFNKKINYICSAMHSAWFYYKPHRFLSVYKII